MKSNNFWAFLKGFDNKYIVSRDGKIVSLNYNRTQKRKELSQFKNGQYLTVKLTKNGKSIHYAVHRAVAETFIPNPDNLPEVNHKSGIKTENFVENLEWCTRSQNVQHAYNTGLKTAPSGKNHVKAKSILQIKDNKIIKKFNCIMDAERCGFQHSKIVMCCQGKRKTHAGYTWRYVDE